MGVDVTPATDEDAAQWNDLVERSPQGTPFHLREFLAALGEHANAEVHLLVGRKGQEPVGLFPVFSKSKGPISAVFSPPPDLKISYLGPVLLNAEKLKRRKAERRHRRFVEACLDYLDDRLSPRYTHVRTAPAYTDPRPFVWNDYEVTPAYTYHVDLGLDAEELLSRFSSDARSNIRGAGDDCTVSVGDAHDARRIIRQVRDRHHEQGESFPVTPQFVAELVERLPEGSIRPYVSRVDGAFAGGMVTLELDDTIYRWQGGAKRGATRAGNDVLDWEIICDARERGLSSYDLVGANNPRLCGYKAKFAPELATYASVQKGTRSMNALSEVYKRFR